MKAIMPKSWSSLPNSEKEKIIAYYDEMYNDRLAEETKRINNRAFSTIAMIAVKALMTVFGFGKVRIMRFLNAMQALANEYPDVYGEATFEALQAHIARAGIEIEK